MSAKKLASEQKSAAGDKLSRREREILHILYRHGRATASEVQEALSEAPSYSAVRAMLRILEAKGHATHEQDGQRYVYLPAVSHERAKRSALQHVLRTFFDNSAGLAISALLEVPSAKLSEGDLDRISAMVEKARKEGR
ncbi:MAG: BlaI/MecI/CopY family transcriptional regulator [Bryobacterales bacterium]|nr:BlaI/MecI/CopY family transcriptional regulator [Bryobacterales bacterium]